MNKFVKYLLCIFFSILAINFLINLIGFFKYNSSYLISSRIKNNLQSESLISTGKDLEEKLNTQIDALKKQTSEDYPALGIIYYQTVSHYSSVAIIQNFLFSLIAGFALGNIIFFIFISDLHSYKLTIALILALFVTSLLLTLSDVYTAYANNETAQFGLSQIFWNMEVSGITYIIVCILTLIAKKIYKTYYEIRYS